jgi:TonB family protein
MKRLRPSLFVIACLALPSSARAQAAPRVALGSVSVAGPVPTGEARRVLRQALPGVTRCYDDRLRERPELAGRMKVRLFVSSDGAPVGAQIDESDVGDDALGRCLTNAVMALAFAEHEAADSHVSFELRFGDPSRPSGVPHVASAGPDDPRFLGEDEETRELRPAPPAALRAVVRAEPIDVRGPRPRAQIDSALRRVMPRMRRCYEEALTRDRRLAGDLRVRFKVDRGGRAREVQVETEPNGDGAFTRCLGDAIESARFEPASGRDTEVVAKILLRPPAGLDEDRAEPAGRGA